MLDSLKSLFVQSLSKQIYVALVAIPGFGWVFALPVVRNITQAIIEKAVGWATQETAVGLSLLWIQLDMQYEIKTAEEGAVRLREMLENPTKYSAAEQEVISESFDQDSIDLIQLSIRRLA